MNLEEAQRTVVAERDTLRARVAELERERDAARADAYEKVQALAAVSGVLLGNDVPSTWNRYGAVADARKCAALRADAARLREALEALVEYERKRHPPKMGGDHLPPTLREVMDIARAALASAPSAEPTPRDMRVAEAVYDATVRASQAYIDRDEFPEPKRFLAAVVAKALEVGT